MAGNIGFPESTSMAVGGMVGGGIFAVLGVVAVSAGPAAWLAFAAAGGIALCAGYSFVRLNRLCDGESTPIAQIERLTGNADLAGMVGWLFTFGYVGTMSMYAFAFGGYARELLGVHRLAGVSTRPLLSVAAVALFVGLNLVGARASGRVEDALVAGKVAILLVVGVGGLLYGLRRGTIESGVTHLGVGPLTAAAIAFVAFEGWELLLFGQSDIEDPVETTRKAIYVSIVATTALYAMVAVVTTNLVPTSVVRTHAETALAVAARPFLGRAGFVLVGVAAVISTASALNATLFSAARLSREVAEARTPPDRQGAAPDGGSAEVPEGADRSGPPTGGQPLSADEVAHGTETGHHRADSEEPGADSEESGSLVRTLLVLGTLTAVLTVYGDLNSLTSFASGAFITIFGGASALAFVHRDDRLLTAVVPAAGAVGALAAVLALFWHLHRTDPDVLVTVMVIWTVVLTVYWVPRRR